MHRGIAPPTASTFAELGKKIAESSPADQICFWQGYQESALRQRQIAEEKCDIERATCISHLNGAVRNCLTFILHLVAVSNNRELSALQLPESLEKKRQH